MPILKRGRQLAAGVSIFAASVLFAVVCVGPIVRLLLGPPRDFGSDYVSGEVLIQAVAAVMMTTTAICMAVGWASARAGRALTLRDAIWMINPLTIAMAFIILLHAVDTSGVLLQNVQGEYLSPAMVWNSSATVGWPLML